MKATNTVRRVDRLGKHNDRNFDVNTQKDHIDPEKVKYDRLWSYDGSTWSYDGNSWINDDGSGRAFRDLEIEFYKKTFAEHIRKQNERYRARRKYHMNRNAKFYHHLKRTQPQDQLLQIGNKDEHVSGEVMWQCALDYQKRFNDKYGDHCKILNMALHMEEATPHVQIRRVWLCKDDNGDPWIGQTRALAEMGIPLPDEKMPEDKHNNRAMTFTAMDQEMFREVCRERGLEIEEPEHTGRQHLETIEYKTMKAQEDLERTLDKVDQINEEIEEKEEVINEMNRQASQMSAFFEDLLLNPMFNGEYDEEVRKAREKKESERLQTLMKIFAEKAVKRIPELVDLASIESARKWQHLRSKVRAAEHIIKKNGLEKEYKKERERQIVL